MLAIHKLTQELRDGLSVLSPDAKSNPLTASEFALEMVEGVPKVRFTITDDK